MSSSIDSKNFSSYADKNGDGFNDLDELAQDSNIVKIEKDEVSSLEKVVLNNGPFAFNSTSYLNDTVKDCLFVNSHPIKNQNFPVNISSNGYFDVHIDLKSDYMLFPASLSVTLDVQLYVRGSDGNRRVIQDADLLVPVDMLQPVKNIRPVFDSKSTIQPGKQIDQRNLGRVLRLLTETTEKSARLRRINYSRSFFEQEKTVDNIGSKTHSHKWVAQNGGKVIQIYNLGDEDSSYQNTYLSKVIEDAFQFRLDLSNVPPFNSAIVYSRPLETIVLSLEFCKFSEWLRIATPDGTPPVLPSTPSGSGVTSVLQKDLSNLELDIKNVTVSYSQFALNQALLDQYIKHTVSNSFSNIPYQVTEAHYPSSPLKKGSRNWSVLLNNIIVPERIYIYFQTDANKNKVPGNPFYYSNLGVKEISFNVLSTSENRYNQHRTSSFGTPDTIVTTSEAYALLDLNKKYRSNAHSSDLILNANYLAAGVTGLGGNLKHTFLTNEVSIYEGMCVYTINTGMQLQKNRLLREITRRGNCEISFVFNKQLVSDYYCTMFLSYGGELIVSNILRICINDMGKKKGGGRSTIFSLLARLVFRKVLDLSFIF